MRLTTPNNLIFLPAMIHTSQNPLLQINEHQDFDQIKAEHIQPAIEHWLTLSRDAIETAAQTHEAVTWENLIDKVDDVTENLSRAWSAVSHLNSVMNTPVWREAYNQTLPLVSEFWTWVGLHEGLYQRYKELANSQTFQALTPTRQRIVELALRSFKMSGVELQGPDREEFAKISARQAEIAQKFSENVLDATDDFALHITDKQQLEGIPDDVLSLFEAQAQSKELSGWLITLQIPNYLPIMQYAKDRTLREKLYHAYCTRASDQGNTKFDNSALIEESLLLRSKEARLLGYQDFADKQLVTRMAHHADDVVRFLTELASKSRPFALNDMQELRTFAQDHLALHDLQPWDLAFASEQLKIARYDYSEQEIKQYFTEPQVIQGLFDIIQSLFAVKLTTVEAPTWHPSVRVIEITRQTGEIMGYLYCDLFARAGKQGGAWVDQDRSRRLRLGVVHHPIGFLTCNFAAPSNDKPAVLTHDDVITLFHEMGHALHLLLSEVDDVGASPFTSVEWDAIELPSQFMENFCWEWSVIEKMTAHVNTGEKLPKTLFDRLLAAKNFQSGMQMLRQVEFALFDMQLHQQSESLNIKQVLSILQQLRQQIAVFETPDWNRMPHSFSHIFAGGYAAGYYSYKWAEVLSADAYAAFEEQQQNGSTVSRDVGLRFQQEILAVGGERPAMASFKAFRGREPSIDALLRHSGLSDAN